MANILFGAPHPDDAEIFCAGTIAMLITQGHNVHVVCFTSGELGENTSNVPLENIRRQEAIDGMAVLGVPEENCHFLGYIDSGMTSPHPKGSFVNCNANKAAHKLALIIDEFEITTLVCDDKNGIYGHPDHKKAHVVGSRAAQMRPDIEFFVVTIDREYLHFLETQHVVQDAREAYELLERGSQPPLNTGELFETVTEQKEKQSRLNHTDDFGSATVEITHAVNALPYAGLKRDALAVHKSQISSESPAMKMSPEDFAQTYGLEYFIREQNVSEGTQSAFDNLPQSSIFGL